MKETVLCGICNQPYPRGELTEFRDELICPDCLRESTLTCFHCGERILLDENAGDSRTPLCERCYENYYLFCCRCGNIIHRDNAYYEGDDEESPLCHDCYTRYHRSHSINDYYYKPEPIFHGSGPASSAWSWKSTARASTAAAPNRCWTSPIPAASCCTASMTAL